MHTRFWICKNFFFFNKEASFFIFDHLGQWCFTLIGRRHDDFWMIMSLRRAVLSLLFLQGWDCVRQLFSCPAALQRFRAMMQSDDRLAFCYILGIWLDTHVLLQNSASFLHVHTSRFWEDTKGLQLCRMQWLHRSRQLLCWWLAFSD